MMELLIGILILIVGGLDGVIDATIGASGGMINVPVLTLLGLPIKAAIGTSLAVDIVGDSVVAYTYHEHKNIDFKLAISLIFGTVIGAQIGATIGSEIPNFGLEALFSIFLIIFGILFYRLRGRFNNLFGFRISSIKSSRDQAIASIITGLIIGGFAVIFGGGGGWLIFMALLIIIGLPMHKAVGTSVFVEIFSSASGCIGYAIRGHIDLSFVVVLIIGVIIGGRLTARYANRINEDKLSRLIAITFVILGLLMIILI